MVDIEVREEDVGLRWQGRMLPVMLADETRDCIVERKQRLSRMRDKVNAGRTHANGDEGAQSS